MGSYPQSPRSEFLAWCQGHAVVFAEHAAEIGLTQVQVVNFNDATSKAAEALAAQLAAQETAKSATAAASMKFAELRRVTGVTVGVIKSFAQATDDPNVYVLAQIPAPQTGTPAPPPAQPTDLRVTLDPADGALTIAWKAANPTGTQGTSYIIRRRVSTTAPFEFIGVTGSKKFVDSGFFAGPDMVQYTVQGQRADSTGPLSQILTVNFGRVGGGGGGFTVTSTSTDGDGAEDVRLAA